MAVIAIDGDSQDQSGVPVSHQTGLAFSPEIGLQLKFVGGLRLP